VPPRPFATGPWLDSLGVRRHGLDGRGPDRPGPRPSLVVWYITCVRITRSARRHGVNDEAIRHAVTNAIRLIETDDGLFIIGADTSGQMLEVVARPSETGDLIVFHAMPLRPANVKRYLP